MTLLVLWYLLVTYLAALLSTISNVWLALAVRGFQAYVAYSCIGMTRGCYARVVTVSDGVRIFLFKSPSVRFAVEMIVTMCWFRFRSGDIVMPIHLTYLTISSGSP